MAKYLLLMLLFGICMLPIHAQRPMEWEEFVTFLTENEEDAEQDDWNDYLEELSQVHQHPINVNAATGEELRKLSLLSEEQIADLLQYVQDHQGMYTLNELLLLPTFTYQERRYLPLFLCALPHKATPNAPINWRDTHHQLLSRIDVPLYHRRGYLVPNGYRGGPIYNKVSYQLQISRHLTASLRTERDGGEKGIDSYGAHVMLTDLPLMGKQRVLRLNAMVLGDFKVGFGQGLVLRQGFSMGKDVKSSDGQRPFRPHQSTDEVNFMRGVGLSVAYTDFTLSLFYSHRSWDATLATDASGLHTTVTTIVRSGYHRTASEYDKKGVLGVDVLGGNLSWRQRGYHAGVTGYFLRTDMPLVPGNSLYRRIYPQGNRFGNVGVDYGYDAYRWKVFGELAFDGDALAALHGASWRISQRYTLMALQRYYNYNYYSFFSSAISEGGGVQNETGGTLRLNSTPLDGLQVTAYADVFYNPWPRYGLTHSSYGWDAMLEAELEISRNSHFSVRYNVKQKEESNAQVPKSQHYMPIHHRLRMQWQLSLPSNNWHFSTTVLLHHLKGSTGEAIGQHLRYTQGNRWRVLLSGIYFHTSDYSSRLYLYEPNVSGMLYMPSFSGHGVRGALSAQYKLWHDRLRFELKYGLTRYFDRQTQGSALQTIYSPVKNDITLQLGVKF